MSVFIKSPTRVDLAGGTLDCWPLYLLFGECLTINVSINVYTEVRLSPLEDQTVIIDIKDYALKKSYANVEQLFGDSDPRLNLINTVLKYWKPSQGFELSTASESSIGGGLGGSSSLLVGLIKAFSKWLNDSMSKFDSIKLASDLEAQVLKKPTGTQDYYPAFEPGLHFLTFRPGEVIDEVINPDAFDIINQLFLVDTGRAHHSGFNNWQVIKQAIDGHEATLSHLSQLRDVAFEVKDCLIRENESELPRLFEKEYIHRTQLSPHFTSPEIEKLKKIAETFGGQIKICGAGGGGSVLAWIPPESQVDFKYQLKSQNFRLIEFEAVFAEASN